MINVNPRDKQSGGFKNDAYISGLKNCMNSLPFTESGYT